MVCTVRINRHTYHKSSKIPHTLVRFSELGISTAGKAFMPKRAALKDLVMSLPKAYRSVLVTPLLTGYRASKIEPGCVVSSAT